MSARMSILTAMRPVLVAVGSGALALARSEQQRASSMPRLERGFEAHREPHTLPDTDWIPRGRLRGVILTAWFPLNAQSRMLRPASCTASLPFSRGIELS